MFNTKKQLYMVFDVEAVGLHGTDFSVGFVVINQNGCELNPVIQSKNSGQGGTKLVAPLALPEAKKNLRASDASLLSLVANLYAANK